MFSCCFSRLCSYTVRAGFFGVVGRNAHEEKQGLRCLPSRRDNRPAGEPWPGERRGACREVRRLHAHHQARPRLPRVQAGRLAPVRLREAAQPARPALGLPSDTRQPATSRTGTPSSSTRAPPRSASSASSLPRTSPSSPTTARRCCLTSVPTSPSCSPEERSAHPRRP